MRDKRLSFIGDLFATISSQFNSSFFWSSRRKTVKLFDYCSGCRRVRMSAVPQGAFAAQKVRQEWQKHLNISEDETPNVDSAFFASKSHNRAETAMETPMKYSSKLMNSIWGLYNRYSVHNFKKNTDGKMVFCGEQHHINGAVSPSSISGMFQ